MGYAWRSLNVYSTRPRQAYILYSGNQNDEAIYIREDKR
jgi:hypothetical protein